MIWTLGGGARGGLGVKKVGGGEGKKGHQERMFGVLYFPRHFFYIDVLRRLIILGENNYGAGGWSKLLVVLRVKEFT